MSSIVTWKWRAGLLAAALALLPSANSAFAQPFEMKLAYFVGDQHAMSQWLIKWSDKLASRIPAAASPSSASRDRRWARCSSTTTWRAPARPTSPGSCTARRRDASR